MKPDAAKRAQVLEAESVPKRAASDGHLVLFGIAPRSPATGYGYIEAGSRLDGHDGPPEASAAERYMASGRHWWPGPFRSI